MHDAWGTGLRYDLDGETFRISSAGRDKQFGTADDVQPYENRERN